MNAIDIGLVVVLLLCALRGSWRGLFRESFGFAALIGGLLAALRCAEPAAAWLGTVAPVADVNPTAVLGAAFVGVFLVASTIINLVGVATDQVLGRGALRIPSRIVGALFAAAKGAAVIACGLLFLQLFPVVKGLDRLILDSRLARPLVSAAEKALRSEWHGGAAPGADRPA
ncbi:CvpA family protein [bacterium]|nr:CvpA family protein [bacterium]